eukprot:10006955-Karenia_brevis.AAC.1
MSLEHDVNGAGVPIHPYFASYKIRNVLSGGMRSHFMSKRSSRRQNDEYLANMIPTIMIGFRLDRGVWENDAIVQNSLLFFMDVAWRNSVAT